MDDIVPGDLAKGVTFPVLIKAVSGGGGRGIRLARTAEEMAQMVTAARQEARAAFGDDTVYLEPLVQNARHIEVQILGDGNGQILYLGERECSIQRRRQKLIEEAPAPGLSLSLRHHLYDAALKLAEALNYRSLGTVEFLLDPQGHFYFIEVNPRIQVEHPVTEMVTGIDLVRAQLLAGGGRPSTLYPGTDPHERLGHRSARAGRRPQPRISCPSPARSPTCASRAVRAYGWTAPFTWACPLPPTMIR